MSTSTPTSDIRLQVIIVLLLFLIIYRVFAPISPSILIVRGIITDSSALFILSQSPPVIPNAITALAAAEMTRRLVIALW